MHLCDCACVRVFMLFLVSGVYLKSFWFSTRSGYAGFRSLPEMGPNNINVGNDNKQIWLLLHDYGLLLGW